MNQTTQTYIQPARFLHKLYKLGLSVALSAGVVTTTMAESVNDLEIAGYVEKVQLMGTDFIFKARMDTGATTSSLSALNIKRFKRKGKSWVRFQTEDPTKPGEYIELEYPVVRNVRIIRHDGDHQRRPIIELPFCIGTHQRLAEVSLIDRSELTYPLLIGRNHMRNAVLVDSSKRYLLEPTCTDAS